MTTHRADYQVLETLQTLHENFTVDTFKQFHIAVVNFDASQQKLVSRYKCASCQIRVGTIQLDCCCKKRSCVRCAMHSWERRCPTCRQQNGFDVTLNAITSELALYPANEDNHYGAKRLVLTYETLRNNSTLDNCKQFQIAFQIILQYRAPELRRMDAEDEAYTTAAMLIDQEKEEIENHINKEKLHNALERMYRKPLLEYYADLCRQYPERVKIAVPISYYNKDTELNACNHRMEDRCSTRILVYTNDFLSNHSNHLQNLPAITLNENSEWTVSLNQSTTEINQPTRIWVFFPDEVKKNSDPVLSNSARVEAICQKYDHIFHNAHATSHGLTYADIKYDYGATTVPIELLLEEDVHIHVLLAIQRKGELVSMPGSSSSQYYSSTMHLVHALPSALPALAISANYCSYSHLANTLITKLDKNWFKYRYPSSKDEKEIFNDRNMNHSSLEAQRKVMYDDEVFRRNSEAISLELPEEIIRLLEIHVPCVEPEFIERLRMIVAKKTSSKQQRRFKQLLLNISEAMEDSISECNSYYGCGHVLAPAVKCDNSHVNVFELSQNTHVRPLFFLRLVDRTQEQAKFVQSLKKWSDIRYGYNHRELLEAHLAKRRDIEQRNLSKFKVWSEVISQCCPSYEPIENICNDNYGTTVYAK